MFFVFCFLITTSLLCNRRKCDSKSESYKDNVNLMKFGGFSKEVKMSKVFKYNEVNSKNEGIRRTRSRKGFVKEGEDDDLKIERVAFKNFEESNIVNKPRVSKMEMEERIQKLAKSYVLYNLFSSYLQISFLTFGIWMLLIRNYDQHFTTTAR